MSAPLLLLRHARAGDSETWPGDDRDRPLDAKGWKQAGGLVGRLESFRIDAIYTSPYRRCVDTVLPIAAARGLRPELRPELAMDDAAGAAFVQALAGRPMLVCGHGGLELVLVDPPRWRKAQVLLVDAGLRVVGEA